MGVAHQQRKKIKLRKTVTCEFDESTALAVHVEFISNKWQNTIMKSSIYIILPLEAFSFI